MKQLLELQVAAGLFALLHSAAALAQDSTPPLDSLVRLSCTRDGDSHSGSGFVISLASGTATIVTASHVIEGARCEVEFTDSTERWPVDRIRGLETGDPHGLAAVRVRGVPDGVTVLELDAEASIAVGEPLLVAEFPQKAERPRAQQERLSDTEAKLLLISRESGGASGGPVLRGGRAVGIITEVEPHRSRAVNAKAIRETLEDWDISLDDPPP